MDLEGVLGVLDDLQLVLEESNLWKTWNTPIWFNPMTLIKPPSMQSKLGFQGSLRTSLTHKQVRDFKKDSQEK